MQTKQRIKQIYKHTVI